MFAHPCLYCHLISFSGVTVLLIPPDPESVEASAVGAETFDHPVEPATAMKSEDPTTVGEHWEVSEDPNVDRYCRYLLHYIYMFNC